MLHAQSRQKSYVDRRHLDLEFQVRDYMLLNVSPWNGVSRFWKRGKLGPRYIGSFGIIIRVGKVVCRLVLSDELSQIDNTLHVSQLQKCLANESAVVPLDENQVYVRLNYIERLIVIPDKRTKTLRNKVVGLVKVERQQRKGFEWT